MSLVSLNISSNNIGHEGSNYFFLSMKNHPSLTAIDLSNIDHIHKNMIGSKGCINLTKYLQENNVVSILNLSGNGIKYDGFDYISDGMMNSKSMVSLNLSRNEIPKSCIYIISFINRSSNNFIWITGINII